MEISYLTPICSAVNLGLLCLGKSDYEAITAMGDDDYFKSSLGITNVPSAERLRQRLDEQAENYLSPVISDNYNSRLTTIISPG